MSDNIAHAREDIPALLAEVERLKAENERNLSADLECAEAAATEIARLTARLKAAEAFTDKFAVLLQRAMEAEDPDEWIVDAIVLMMRWASRDLFAEPSESTSA